MNPVSGRVVEAGTSDTDAESALDPVTRLRAVLAQGKLYRIGTFFI